jgi:ketosteroid isomerase-like protein
MMRDPNFALSSETDDDVVARSGDLAYETGTYEVTMSGPDGEPASQHGHYVVVWEKTDDGSWKAVVDAPVSDPAASAMSAVR